MFRIVNKEEIAPLIHLIEIEAKDIAKKAHPGQFIIIRINEKGERIPLTIADFKDSRVTIVFMEVGKTTMHLASLKAGDQLQDVIGPLGNPSEIKYFGTVVLIGGGIGAAPIFPQARAFKQVGNKVISIIGARSANLLIWEDRIKQVSDEHHHR